MRYVTLFLLLMACDDRPHFIPLGPDGGALMVCIERYGYNDCERREEPTRER